MYKELVFLFSLHILVNPILVHISKLIYFECLYEDNMIRNINKPDIQMFVCGVRKTKH